MTRQGAAGPLPCPILPLIQKGQNVTRALETPTPRLSQNLAPQAYCLSKAQPLPLDVDFDLQVRHGVRLLCASQCLHVRM